MEALIRRTAPATHTASPSRSRDGWILLLLLGVFLATQYPGAAGGPFVNDDYVFLEKIRGDSFLSLWRLSDLTFHWYRPWSRELHYWSLLRLLGPNEIAFHLVSLGLWLGVMAAYAAFAVRLVGGASAWIAITGVAVLSAWAVPLLWVAGVQDLWMLLFGLFTLHAFARGRIVLATVAFALALLSKETAVVWVAIAFAHAAIVERVPVAHAVRRVLPMLAVGAVWAAFHPLIGGRFWGAPSATVIEGLHPPLPAIAGRTLLALVNLDAAPGPEAGWVVALLRALPAVGLLAIALWWWGRRGTIREAEAPSAAPKERRTLAFGIAWAAAGWAPLLLPHIGWHSYYGLVGALGAWLALGSVLASRTPLAVALLAAMIVLRAAQADTPSSDWGTEWYQRRAGAFLRYMKDDLQRRHPKLPPHSRLFFTEVPSQVGFLTGDGPSLRVWYRDPTLSGGYYDQYAPRAAGTPAGVDYFFRYDSTAGWVEVKPGPEDAAVRAANSRWQQDHRELAAVFARANQWSAAAREYRKLALQFPADPDLALDTGVSFEMAGDSLAAGKWYARAAALPGASEEARRFAERLHGNARAHP